MLVETFSLFILGYLIVLLLKPTPKVEKKPADIYHYFEPDYSLAKDQIKIIRHNFRINFQKIISGSVPVL